MKKLNQKGLTTIEVLICFVLVVVITVSMYGTISSFNARRLLEKDKEEITTYKNTLTKTIQDDLIKIGLTHANHTRQTEGAKVIYTVNCDLRDGTKRTLKIYQQMGRASHHAADDYFLIEYGTAEDLIKYPLPKLGTSKVKEHTVQDFGINNVLINIKDDSVLSIYIGFYHPELTTRYAISIIAPINYVSTGSDGTEKWNY